MSYQLVLASVEKVKAELSLLANGLLDSIYIDTNNPKRLAYLLMQGMAAAAELQLPVLCALKDDWKICVEKSRVKCEKIKPIISEPYLEFSEVADLLDLLDVWMKHKDLGVELRFPTIKQSDEIVKEWLMDKPHKWNGSGILTMKATIE